MKLFVDFFPILLFFITYKYYGVFIATAVAMGVSTLQIIYTLIKFRRVETLHLITFVLLLILGGATLFLHNEIFIKWKPTAVYWVFGLILAYGQLVWKQPLIRKLLQGSMDLPDKIWNKLNKTWIIFFAAMGALNLYVAYNFDTNTWVNFKLFGMFGITLVFALLQSMYLTKHIRLAD